MALQRIDDVDENDRMSECIDDCFEAAQACAGALERRRSHGVRFSSGPAEWSTWKAPAH